MTISFNVPDQFIPTFVSASRWQIDRPDLSDSRIAIKYLKQCVGKLIDDYNYYLAVGVETDALKTLQAQFKTTNTSITSLHRQIMDAEQILQEKQATVTMTPTVVDDE